jgi:release factor glutamine methyltransferase
MCHKKLVFPYLMLLILMLLISRSGGLRLQTSSVVRRRLEASRAAPPSLGSIPQVIWEDADIAVCFKPAGVSVSGDKRDRSGLSLEAWFVSNKGLKVPASGGVAPKAVTPLAKAWSGLVPVAKTVKGREDLLAHSLSTNNNVKCGYVALVAHDADIEANNILPLAEVIVFSTSSGASKAFISVIRFSAPASVKAADILNVLECSHCHVIGTAGAPAPGGSHIALIELTLPSGGPSEHHPRVVHIKAPQKIEKTRKRQSLFIERRNRGLLASTGALFECVFMGVNLRVGNDQLRPRPSSKCLVDSAVDNMLEIASNEVQPTSIRILDIGCGAGALLLASLEGFDIQYTGGSDVSIIGVGLDIDAKAVDLAQNNALLWESSRAKRSHVANTIFVVANMGALHETGPLGLDGPFDLIICNPPFLRESAAEGRITLENRGALYAGIDGYDAYRSLSSSMGHCLPNGFLAPGGKLLLQLPAYKDAVSVVRKIFETSGMEVLKVVSDNRGINRCLLLSIR